MAMTMPNHCAWNGSQSHDPGVIQHSSVGAPGSAFHSMKSGTGVSDPCCSEVRLCSFSDIATM